MKNRLDLSNKEWRSRVDHAIESDDAQALRVVLAETGDARLALRGIDWTGLSPVGRAVVEGGAKCLACMLDAGADAEWAGAGGWRALDLAAMTANAQCVEVLLKAGALLDWTDSEGQTALMRGCEFPAVVSALLEAGADCSLVDAQGLSALGHAKRRYEKSLGYGFGYRDEQKNAKACVRMLEVCQERQAIGLQALPGIGGAGSPRL
jgi:hypothetical protein